MISELVIEDLNRSCVLHAKDVPFLQSLPRLEFKPGLNILWAANGAGKSTVLKALARMLHCEQGGKSVVTRDSIDAVFTVPHAKFRSGDRSESMAMGLRPVHDGQCVLHFDPGHAVGLLAGGAAFDWDFGMTGVLNATFHGSSGETTTARISDTLRTLTGDVAAWPKIEWRVDKKAYSQVEEYLKGTLPLGQPTVLLDEPDRSLSMKLQAGLWINLARRFANNVQVIAASHSPFALRLPGAHYIELTPGYLAECLSTVDRHLHRSDNGT